MPVAKPPEIPFRSPLWGLSFKVESIEYRLHSLSRTIENIWLIGTYLAYPINVIGDYTQQSVSLIRDGDKWIVEHRSWLESLFNGSKFKELLESLSSTFYWIRVDPLGWLRSSLRDISTDIFEIIVNSYNWFKYKMAQLFPLLNDVQHNPTYGIRRLIQIGFSEAFVFLLNPFGTLRIWIRNISPFIANLMDGGITYIISTINSQNGWFYSFVYNPVNTIRSFLIQINPDIADFINSPRSWFIRLLAQNLNLNEGELLDFRNILSILVLRNVLNIYDRYKQTLKDLFCQIIIRFM